MKDHNQNAKEKNWGNEGLPLQGIGSMGQEKDKVNMRLKINLLYK